MKKENLSGSPIVSSESAQSLMQDLRQIIDQARGRVASTANYELTMMYWHIGERINREVLGNKRAEYGKQIVAPVVRQSSPSMNALFAFFPNEPFRSMHFLLQKAHALFQQFLRRQRIFDADVVVCRDPHRRAQPTERPLYIG